jgi:hypothetical protein
MCIVGMRLIMSRTCSFTCCSSSVVFTGWSHPRLGPGICFSGARVPGLWVFTGVSCHHHRLHSCAWTDSIWLLGRPTGPTDVHQMLLSIVPTRGSLDFRAGRIGFSFARKSSALSSPVQWHEHLESFVRFFSPPCWVRVARYACIQFRPNHWLRVLQSTPDH